MISTRIFFDSQACVYKWEVVDERPPRMKSTGEGVSLSEALFSVRTELATIVLEKP